MRPTPSDAIGDDEVLTQYGTRHDLDDVEPAFRQRPRSGVEQEISLLRGRWTPAEARARVRYGRAPAGPEDGVRFTVAGAFRSAGFVVSATPTRRNPDHVSVTHPDGWRRTLDLAFDFAFSTPVWGGDTDD